MSGTWDSFNGFLRCRCFDTLVVMGAVQVGPCNTGAYLVSPYCRMH